MRENKYICLLLSASMVVSAVRAQVSHGGQPLPFIQTRSYEQPLFEEMPPFDVEEELRIDALNKSDLRGGYRFAYKFMTHFNRNNSGTSFSLPDGTQVWRLGIRSEGALSINVLFSEYELPEGAQVFLYNPSRTQVLGAFNHLNNSELGILPVAPVEGDELIIEYQEPLLASFAGKLTVGEVNHGYRSLKGYEPGGDSESYSCMLAPVCFGKDSPYDPLSRSTVLLTIDGITACTGVMLNNVLNNGRPYLLTASHCLNNNFTVKNPDYDAIAGRIVSFFNYNSPTCKAVMRGTEEMSVASALYRAVNTKSDMALLELPETPPIYYRPYYAGWNSAESGGNFPYINIHHPLASVQRINRADAKPVLKTFVVSGANFYENCHWNVGYWVVGSTDVGSSGSPLFDSENLLVGILSGGRSTCSFPSDDYFYALFKAWEPEELFREQLKYWLDPLDSKQTTLAGLDPYEGSPCYRLSNVLDSKLQDSIEISACNAPATGNMFGINSLNTNEYAEEYRINGAAQIEGVYVVTPAITDEAKTLDVEIVVYSGDAAPQNLLYSEKFYPVYTELSADSSFVNTEKKLNRSQESFVRFRKPVQVSGVFYAGYKIKSPDNSAFAVYNLPKGALTRNTAWIHAQTQWIRASEYSSVAFNAALFLDPVVRYVTGSADETIARDTAVRISLDAAHTKVYVTLPETAAGKGVYRLYSVSGQLLQEKMLNENHSVISVSELPSGVYIVTIRGNTAEYSQKIVL